jgi:hypothetical protein
MFSPAGCNGDHLACEVQVWLSLVGQSHADKAVVDSLARSALGSGGLRQVATMFHGLDETVLKNDRRSATNGFV